MAFRAPVQPSRGANKFAAMTGANPRRGKVLNAAPASTSPPDSNLSAPTQQRKRQKRQPLWDDLNRAEEMTLQLLQLAQDTASTMDLANSQEDEERLRQNGKKYLDTLQTIHSLLAPHAKHVVNYQNHQVDAKREEGEKDIKMDSDNHNKNMYAARVEMALAMEKQGVLTEWLRLEKK